MVLKLDPTVPIVWRDTQTVQFGVDPLIAVVPQVTPGVERLLAVLAAGVSESGFAMFAETFGLSAGYTRRLRERLAPVLLPMPAEHASAVTREIPDAIVPRADDPTGALVMGSSPLAVSLARVLDEAGVRTPRGRHPRLAVVVADRVVSPADHRFWLQHDIPHLPVVTSENAVIVGPLVEPGVSACLHCLALHERDRDPAWPVIAAQLASAAPPPSAPVRAAAAVALVSRLVMARLRHAPLDDVRELRLTGDGDELSERRFAPHPECRCSALPESDWAPADAPANPRRPSAGRVSAVPG